MNKFLDNIKIPEFVSRGGEKLKFALEKFNINVEGKICADLGCSVGGFTDCLLQNGAKKVYSVDTGKNILEWKIKEDERVEFLGGVNALHVELPEKVDFISIDVSWTPQRLIIPKALSLLKDKGEIISLIKPHYEIDKALLKKGKVPEEFLMEVIDKIKKDFVELGLNFSEIIESPILGQKGKNKEYLVYIQK
ncbi:MAG: TlyA family rRNA (cytidine-2'-O)-methyltransferase [Candidatus Pacebacteria bacterium]|nr:TlyA family rRNA (cytidine-2'-O)-methyltransferase [Candidatus Paceibacterota bacterium]